MPEPWRLRRRAAIATSRVGPRTSPTATFGDIFTSAEPSGLA
ncbi:hypothetical protein [Nonomuraea insulae]|uniref:Uncharacterized protein n=1 Tax=Nonomuraea insulae TaxID=1616787 RepID=A0ABW1CK52_9ACTN